MKSVKKILALVLATLMIAACFAACGGKEEPQGSAGGEIVIGVQGPLTGGAAQYGIAVKQAAELAANEINAAGGINGIKLKVIAEDDQATPGDLAKNAYNSLLDNGMQVFLGTVTTGAGLGFTLVLVIFAAIRERLAISDVPEPFKNASSSAFARALPNCVRM